MKRTFKDIILIIFAILFFILLVAYVTSFIIMKGNKNNAINDGKRSVELYLQDKSMYFDEIPIYTIDWYKEFPEIFKKYSNTELNSDKMYREYFLKGFSQKIEFID